MKKLITIMLILAIFVPIHAQDITSKLGGDTANETYDVTDSADKVLFRVQGDGKVGIGETNPSEVLVVDGNIAVNGTVDGIDIATDVTANNAKVTNATHTGDVTGSTALTIGANKVTEAHLKAVDTPNDEEYLTYETTTGDFEWQPKPTTSLGDWSTSYTAGTTYLAATDGFVVCMFGEGGGGTYVLVAGTGLGSTPWVIQKVGNETGDGFTIPVKKGHNWTVYDNAPDGGSAWITLRWIPLGN